MVYYDDGKILIRNMQQSDVPVITQGERDQGWDADGEKYRMRLQHQVEGRSISLVAEYQGQVAGYVNVYPDSQWGAFANRGYPEIVDFGVLEPYRRQGVGSKLMDLAEEIAAQDFILTPGRYVGIAAQAEDSEPFAAKMERLTGELSDLFARSHDLEAEIRRQLESIGYKMK